MWKRKPTDSMKLLHIVGDSRFGGAGRIILGLGRAAKEAGWQVEVLATDPVFQQAIRREGLGVVDLDVIRREIRPAWDTAGLWRLYRFLRRERYRAVHTHTSKAGFVGRLAARMAGVPAVVHTVHGFAFHERSPWAVRRFYSTLERIAAHWCDRIVSVSRFHRDWAVSLGICDGSRITAIPNGIAPPPRNRAISSVCLRRRLQVPGDGPLILSMARLAPGKGLEYLIEAAASLPPELSGARIAIAGDGPARTAIERLAEERGVGERVILLGFREDVGDLLAACDIVALPSLREGLSIALLEAMSAGKPIIATSIGSHVEVASQAEIALLVPPADSGSLAAAIAKLANDLALRARLGHNARELFEKHYTEDRMLDGYRQLYANLPGAASRAADLAAGFSLPDWAARQPGGRTL
jgi:glycosyltransferase involved in cell wall biosynthesis